MFIKLLALDLDGTLLADWATMTTPVQAAVRAASQQGIHIVIATGREFPLTVQFYHQLGLETPVICFHGAYVYNPHSDEIILDEGLGVPMALQLINLSRRYNIALYLFDHNQVYTEHSSPEGDNIFNSIGSVIVPVDDLKEALTFSPVKGIIAHSVQEVAWIMPMLKASLDTGVLSIANSLDTSIEIFPSHISKGNALATVADHYGIARHEVMAIGDQDNDVDMLEWAGLGVAMGNGSERAKAAADVIAPPVDKDGAAWAIERYVLNGR